MILHGAVELTKNLRNPHHDCKREVFNGAKRFEDENAQDLKAKTKIAIYGLNIGEYPKHRTGSGLVNKLRNLQNGAKRLKRNYPTPRSNRVQTGIKDIFRQSNGENCPNEGQDTTSQQLKEPEPCD